MYTVDELGGEQGVTVTGIIGTMQTVVTPPAMSPFSDLAKLGAAVGDPGGLISDGWKHAGGILADIWQGTVAQPGGDWWKTITGHSHHGHHIAGAVLADRSAMGPWETFVLFGIGGSSINLLSWQGYFSAQSDGSVYANRSEAQAWEKWELLHNGDGTVSLRALEFNRFFTAEHGGGDACNANRTAIGPWEKFRPVFTSKGLGLKTLDKNLLVSVQP